MTAPVFVDTNVLLYARDAGEPAKQPLARQWLEQLWLDRTGRTSTQVLTEFYVNATRKLVPGMPAERAWEDVEALLTWSPQPVNAELLIRGRAVEQRYRLSWWDSLIVAAAQLQDCALLLTEDLQDGARYGDVRVQSPFTPAVSEPGAPYAIRRLHAKPLHRGRGRPVRTLGPPGR
jgi:predicted nucleic acid-binding protein